MPEQNEPEKPAILPGTHRCELCNPPVLVKNEDCELHKKTFHKVIGGE